MFTVAKRFLEWQANTLMTIAVTVRTEIEINQEVKFAADALVADVTISHKFLTKKFEKASQALKELKCHESLSNNSNNNINIIIINNNNFNIIISNNIINDNSGNNRNVQIKYANRQTSFYTKFVTSLMLLLLSLLMLSLMWL